MMFKPIVLCMVAHVSCVGRTRGSPPVVQREGRRSVGQPDPELTSGTNDVARTPEQMRAELEARLGRFFKAHISTQIMRHRLLTAPIISDLLDVWYPIVEPHLRNLTGRRVEVRIEDIIAIFRVAVAQVPKTPAAPGMNPGASL